MEWAKSGILQEFQSKFASGFCGNIGCREKCRLIFSQIVWVGIDSTTPQYGNTGCRVFKGGGGTKLETFLPKNQHTQRKLLN